jgi:hypothetical protein
MIQLQSPAVTTSGAIPRALLVEMPNLRFVAEYHAQSCPATAAKLFRVISSRSMFGMLQCS